MPKTLNEVVEELERHRIRRGQPRGGRMSALEKLVEHKAREAENEARRRYADR